MDVNLFDAKNEIAHCYCNFLPLKQSISLHCDNVKRAPQINNTYAFSDTSVSEKKYV